MISHHEDASPLELNADLSAELVAKLQQNANYALADDDRTRLDFWPGPVTWRQPIHTVYIPAEQFDAGIAKAWGEEGLANWRKHAGSRNNIADYLGVTTALAAEVAPLVETKLQIEPVEDLRIDFEDGFTQHGVAAQDKDADEDAHLGRAVEVCAKKAPAPFWGLRFKCFEAPNRDRGIRTLVFFLLALGKRSALPPGRTLRLTFPKVTSTRQVENLVSILAELEKTLGLDEGAISFEIQVETPQSIIGRNGNSPLPDFITAGSGRVLSLHYGTYDYSAFLGVAAADQALDHPVADHAKDIMQTAVAGRGVELSDGSTNLLPVGARDGIRIGWTVHGHLVGRHLARGIWQGWDLHPNQLPTRFAATYAFFRQRTPQALERLDAYLARRSGAFADEPATAKALASFLFRALNCGAVSETEIVSACGVGRDELVDLTRNGALKWSTPQSPNTGRSMT